VPKKYTSPASVLGVGYKYEWRRGRINTENYKNSTDTFLRKQVEG